LGEYNYRIYSKINEFLIVFFYKLLFDILITQNQSGVKIP
jgi:hypothetical protein